MKKVTIIGSLNMDLVTNVKHMPRVGETILGRDFNQIPGGKGANQAVAVAKLGGEVTMVGCVGQDSFAEDLLQSMDKDGVDLNYVKEIKDVPTGVALITVNSEGDNAIVVVPGANYQLTEKHINDALDAIKASEIVVAQLEVPKEVVKYGLKQAKDLGKYTILNPAPAQKLDDELIQAIDLLTPNETELEVLSGVPIKSEDDILKAAQSMIDKGVKELIITLGGKGCLYVNKSSVKRYPSFKVEAIDTTAAGDSFTGAVAVALAQGKPIDEVIAFASKVGALTVTKTGAQSSLPSIEDVMAFKEGAN